MISILLASPKTRLKITSSFNLTMRFDLSIAALFVFMARFERLGGIDLRNARRVRVLRRLERRSERFNPPLKSAQNVQSFIVRFFDAIIKSPDAPLESFDASELRAFPARQLSSTDIGT